MYKKILTITSLVAILSLSVAFPAYANTVPDFGTCLNPQWSQTQVNGGSNHGVVNVGTFSGTDSIYSSNGNVLQCLCADNGNGYQTNWLKTSDFSSSQIDDLKTQGWIVVADGSQWGLSETTYLAKNSTYECTSCTPTPTETPAPGPTATPTPGTRIEAASANNTSGLASTGNAFVIYVSLSAGLASLGLGILLRKLSK